MSDRIAIAARAAEIIRERGWVQGHAETDDGVCLTRALALAGADPPATARLVAYNDAAGRTVGEVLEAIARWGEGPVVAHAGSQGVAHAGSVVDARDGSVVIAHAGSQVDAYADSLVDARDGSLVVAHAGSLVVAHAGSRVTAYAGSRVVAYAGSLVDAHDGSRVDAYAGSVVGDRP